MMDDEQVRRWERFSPSPESEKNNEKLRWDYVTVVFLILITVVVLCWLGAWMVHG